MSKAQSRTFEPRFEGRTRDAVVTAMIGNVVSIRMKRKKRRPALQSTAVLCTAGRAH